MGRGYRKALVSRVVRYSGIARKDRRRKAAAVLPGQVDLAGTRKPAVRLPLKIPPGVHTLFLGLGPGMESAKRGHYFPGASNYFWKLLYRSEIWPEKIDSDHDDEILKAGFGLADVIQRPTEGTVVATKAEFMNAKERVRALVNEHKPKLVVFVGLKAFRTYLRRDDSEVEYGVQTVRIGDAKVFVVPSTSGASVGVTSYDEKMDWFVKLKAEIELVRSRE